MEETNVTAQEALVIAAIVVGITVGIILIISTRIRRAWRAAAAATGLPLVGKTRIEATVPGGRLVALNDDRLVDWGLDVRHQSYTSVVGRLDHSPPEGLVACRDGWLAGKRPPFSTGDAEFDALVVVDVKDVEAGRAYLTPRRRKALLRLFMAVPKGQLRSATVSRDRDGTMGAKELTRTIQAVKDALEGLAAPDQA